MRHYSIMNMDETLCHIWNYSYRHFWNLETKKLGYIRTREKLTFAEDVGRKKKVTVTPWWFYRLIWKGTRAKARARSGSSKSNERVWWKVKILLEITNATAFVHNPESSWRRLIPQLCPPSSGKKYCQFFYHLLFLRCSISTQLW